MGTSKLLGKPGVTCDGLAFHSGGVEILPAASCYKDLSFGNYELVGSVAAVFCNYSR